MTLSEEVQEEEIHRRKGRKTNGWVDYVASLTIRQWNDLRS